MPFGMYLKHSMAPHLGSEANVLYHIDCLKRHRGDPIQDHIELFIKLDPEVNYNPKIPPVEDEIKSRFLRSLEPDWKA